MSKERRERRWQVEFDAVVHGIHRSGRHYVMATDPQTARELCVNQCRKHDGWSEVTTGNVACMQGLVTGKPLVERTDEQDAFENMFDE